MPPSPQKCPKCESTFDAAAFGGACPRCLMSAGPTRDGGDAVAIESDQDLPGHRVIELLGRGGMGSVYRAQQRSLEREVAVKIIFRAGVDEDIAERFTREAKVLAQLAHPNIVPIYDCGEDELGQLFYTMKIVKGRTLQEILAELREGSTEWTLDRLLGVFRKICDAVAFAHSRGIIHRDLKPENVMVGEFGEVLVMDWGLAKRMRDEGGGMNAERSVPTDLRLPTSDFTATMHGAVLGTPHYMSPEQARGEVESLDERTDIFSLGGILYALLTLRPPVAGSTLDEVLANVRSGNIPAPATQQTRTDDGGPARFHPLRHVRGGRIPAALSAVAMKALASDPARRFPSVMALAADVDAYLGGFATSAENAGAFARAWLFAKRHRTLSLAAAAIVVLTAGFMVKVLASERRATAHAHAAEIAAEDARTRERETRITLADSFAQQGLRAGEEGWHGRAQLWFTLAAETASDDPARVALNRQRARLWGAESVRLTGVIPGVVHTAREARFHPTGPWLMLAKADADLGPGPRQLLHTKRLAVLPWGAGSALVESAAFEPGTERVAVSRRPGEVKILRLGDLGIEATIALPGEPQPVRALAWSDDGRWLFIGAQTARLWDARAQRLVDSVFPHEAAVAIAQFSADGTRLLTATHTVGGRDERSTVRVFAIPPEGAEAAPLFAPAQHRFWIDAMPPRFSADGQRFFTQPENARLVTRDASTGAVLRETACDSSINAIFPDERRGTCIHGIVDLETGQLVQRLEIGRAQISPDGTTVLDGENALLRSAADLAPLRPFGDQFGVEFAAFSADGSQALTIEHEGPLRLWSLAKNPPWRYVASVPGVPILSADSRWLVSGGSNDTEIGFGKTLSVQVHSLATGAKGGPRIEPGGCVLHAAFSRDAATLALACSATPEYTPANSLLPDGRGGNVQLFDWRAGKRRGAIVPLPAAPLRIACAPDDRTFVVYCANGDIVTLPADQSASPTVIATIAETGEPRGAIPPRAGLIFSQDGQSLLVRLSGGAPKFTVIDWPARKVRATLPAGGTLVDFAEHGGIVGLMRFGRFGGKDPSFWQLSDLKPAPTPIDYAFKEYAYFGRFSEDGRLFMMSGEMPDVRVWDWRTGQRAVPDLPHVNAPADFVTGQPWIFSAGSVGGVSSARLWDRASGQLAAPSVPLPGGRITIVMASADGRFLVAAAAGGSAGFYIFDIAAWVGRADPTHTDADLKDFAELNSFRRLEGSGLVRLSREEWLARWERLRTPHADLFDFESVAAKGAARAPIPRDADGWQDLLGALTGDDFGDGASWQFEDGVLRSSERAGATVTFPVDVVGASYQLRIRLRQSAPKEVLHLMLPVGDRMVGFDLDGAPFAGHYTGLVQVDGKWGKNLPGSLHGKQIQDSEPHDIEVTVRLDGPNATFTATLDGRPWYDWAGPVASLSQIKYWRSEPGKIGFATMASDWSVSAVKVRKIEKAVSR